MKNTFIVVVVVLIAIIVVLVYKKTQDNKDADNLLLSGAESTTTSSENGVITTTTTKTPAVPVAETLGFKKGDKVIVKSGTSMRTLSDPNIIAYETTTSQKGWVIDRDLFKGTFKSGKTTATGTWAIISKDVVGFGMGFVSGINSFVKIYQVVHISRITKA